MPDVFHLFGSDLSFGPTGDIAAADVPAVTLQRVLRRLLTNAGDYLWNLQYGAGLPSLVGQPANADAIRALIRSQMGLEAAVAQTPPASVTVSAGQDGTVLASVNYTDAVTGQQQVLTVPVS